MSSIVDNCDENCAIAHAYVYPVRRIDVVTSHAYVGWHTTERQSIRNEFVRKLFSAIAIRETRGMNTFVRRDKIVDELRRESKGSFVTLHRALVEASEHSSAKHNGDTILSEDVVKSRIRAIVKERIPAAKQVG